MPGRLPQSNFFDKPAIKARGLRTPIDSPWAPVFVSTQRTRDVRQSSANTLTIAQAAEAVTPGTYVRKREGGGLPTSSSRGTANQGTRKENESLDKRLPLDGGMPQETLTVSRHRKVWNTDGGMPQGVQPSVGKTSTLDGGMPLGTPISTPVNTSLLKTLLRGYQEADRIVAGFTEGFKFHFSGQECQTTCRNSKEANIHSSAVDDKIQQELNHRRIAGPFKDPPFLNFKCSPLSLREKSEPGTFRLLHNLSYPYDTSSVNGGIPQEHKTVHYSTVQTAIRKINELGRGSYMAKADIKSAYRIVPIHPDYHHLLGFKWRDNFYYDKYLPMGLAESCAIFESISDAFAYIMGKFGIKHIVKILDDFLILAPTKDECDLALKKFKFIANELGIPLASEKTSLEASKQITFLGILLDTDNMSAALPPDKLKRYAKDIRTLLETGTSSVRKLLQLIGKLHFATSVVPIGKPFLRRLIDASSGRKLESAVHISNEMSQDLQLWLSFLNDYNGITLIRLNPSCTNQEINLYTDASDLGFAGSLGPHWIQGRWTDKWKGLNIAVRELYPIVVLIGMFAHKLRNHAIVFNCDNQAIVACINKQSSRSPSIMALLRPLILTLMLNNINFKAVYIRSELNTLADTLSRFQEDEEFMKHYNLNQVPTEIPFSMRPEAFITD